MDNNAIEKIHFEISQLEKLLTDAQPLLKLCETKEPDFIERSAAALLLHSFYNGIENILVIISKSIDPKATEKSKWHRSLFEKAFTNADNRERIFCDELKDELGEYLLFRHFVRHSYGFQIVWNKMRPLIENLEPTWEKVKKDLAKFISNLK